MPRSLIAASFALTLFGLLAACQGADRSPPAEDEGAKTPEAFVEAGNDVRLFYRVLGTGGDTLVILHGGPGLTMDYLLEDFRPLSAQHTLVFYDQRGTGRSTLVSDSAALDAQRFADDLEALRRHFGLEKLTLLGHSWGAAVAALYTMRFPERVQRLLIVGGVPLRQSALHETFVHLANSRDSTTRRQMQELQDKRRADPGDVAACRAYYVLWFEPFFADPAAATRVKGDFCAGTEASRRNKILAVDRFTSASLGAYDWRSSLEPIEAPTLVIHGAKDVIALSNAREWAATMPNARLLALEGIGHFTYVEAPDRFFSAVDTFLRGGWPNGAESVARVP